MDFTQLVKEIGIYGAILTVLGYFFIKHIWPRIEKERDANREQRRQEQKQFTDLMTQELSRSHEHSKYLTDEFTKALGKQEQKFETFIDRMTKGMTSLTNEVREPKSKKTR